MSELLMDSKAEERGATGARDLEAHRAGRLALGFGALAAATYALVVVGALVRAHGAGLACPDWPLCFGEVIPEFDLRVGFEWGHRVLALVISLGFLGLSLRTLSAPVLRSAVGALLAFSAAVLGLQILLGALTVWQLLASWTVTSHLIVGNLFALSLAFVTAGLHEAAVVRPAPATARQPRAAAGGVRAVVTLTGALLLFQMVLGGLVSSRYVGLACPEWPTCADGVWFPRFDGAVGLQLLHRSNGYALAAALAASTWAARRVPRAGRLLAIALALVICQIGVGAANVLWRIPVEITGLHSALAALLVLVTGLALREVWRQRR